MSGRRKRCPIVTQNFQHMEIAFNSRKISLLKNCDVDGTFECKFMNDRQLSLRITIGKHRNALLFRGGGEGWGGGGGVRIIHIDLMGSLLQNKMFSISCSFR